MIDEPTPFRAYPRINLMNLANLNKLINVLANAIKTREGIDWDGTKVGFNMVTFCDDGEKDNLDSCRTVACLAGWAEIIQGNAPISAGSGSLSYFLDINESEGYRLAYAFAPDDSASGHGPSHMAEITPEQALKVLEHLRDTGDVDWTIIA